MWEPALQTPIRHPHRWPPDRMIRGGRPDRRRADPADPVGHADPATMARTGPPRADRASQATVGRADRADPANMARAALADRRPVGREGPVDPRPVGRAGPADRQGRGTGTPNAATSTAPRGEMAPPRGVRANRRGPHGADPYPRPEGSGRVAPSTTTDTKKPPRGIKDSTSGASISSGFGSRCNGRLSSARCAGWRGGHCAHAGRRRGEPGGGAEGLRSSHRRRCGAPQNRLGLPSG
ncbi:hypothetical protein MSAS_04110 [Mycobacterium saskatchewanense]|nr:hypothetical protein MSAS_04110 [Mycobacterium saskatchewanense]